MIHAGEVMGARRHGVAVSPFSPWEVEDAPGVSQRSGAPGPQHSWGCTIHRGIPGQSHQATFSVDLCNEKGTQKHRYALSSTSRFTFP